MRPELVFNDLCVQEAPSHEIASSWFSDMVQTIADLIDEGVCGTTIHTNLYLYDIDLIPGEYGFQEWVDDASTDRDLRELAWTLINHAPVMKKMLEAIGEIDEFERSDFRMDDDLVCDALGVALTWDGIAVSLPSDEKWRATEVSISQHLYDADLTQCAVVQHIVRHASIPAHLDVVIDDWRRSASESVSEVAQLVANWELLFPQLDLCAEHQKKTLPALGDQITLKSVGERLYALNVACKRWAETDEIDPTYSFSARPESPVTMANKDRARQRLATCPRRGEDFFVMHCNIRPDGFRLYWLVNREDQRCCIGYVGPHLATSKHKAQ